MTTVIPFNKGSRIDVTQCEPGLVMLLDGTLRWLKADGTLVPVPGAGGGAWGEASTAQFSGSGSPVGVVTPSGKGDLYVDEDAPALWQATGLTNADWQPATGGSQPSVATIYTGTGAPTAPQNSDFAINGAANTSGTFKLTFRAQTTAAIAFDATGDEISTALCLLSTVGAGNAVAWPSYGDLTPNDGTYIVFGETLGGQAVETPTVTDDTTDNGISTSDDSTGAAGTPDATLSGTYYFDTATSFLYVLDSVGPGANGVWMLAGYNGGTVGAAVVAPSLETTGGKVVLSDTGATINVPTQVVIHGALADDAQVLYVYGKDSLMTAVWWINGGGFEVLRATGEVPDPDDINPGECFSYFDDTNGAAKFIRVGKTANGTVVSVESAMT